jgi:hypothetical protein
MTLRSLAVVALAAVLATGLAPAALAAQLPMVGRVTNEVGAPIGGAEVRVGGRRARYQTDSAGYFRVPDVGNGLVYFGVRRVGFRPVADLLRIRAGDTLDVILEALPTELEPVRITAELEAEWERALRRYGIMLEDTRYGSVITSRDIDERDPQWMSDMLQGQVGFTVIGSGSTAQIVGRSRCRPNMYVDGMFTPAFHLNNMPPDAIRLMVLYRNFTALPSQLQVPMADRRCGGIVIHTMR